MSNYCPSIPMPAARKDSARRPYDVPVREESIIDLHYKRTQEQKIIAIVGIGASYNALGKTFVLKKSMLFAKKALKAARVRFIIEGPQMVAND